jgi:TolA-binding protein
MKSFAPVLALMLCACAATAVAQDAAVPADPVATATPSAVPSNAELEAEIARLQADNLRLVEEDAKLTQEIAQVKGRIAELTAANDCDPAAGDCPAPATR